MLPRSSTDPYFAKIYKPLGRFCHHKSIVRPLLSDIVATHELYSTWQYKYENVPHETLSAGIYLKHLQCMSQNGGWATDTPLCQRGPGPIDYSQPAMDGVDVCPSDR